MMKNKERKEFGPIDSARIFLSLVMIGCLAALTGTAVAQNSVTPTSITVRVTDPQGANVSKKRQ